MKVYRVTTFPDVVAEVPPWYLSVTIDTSVLIGGRWWGSSRGTREGLAKDRVPPLDLEDPVLARWAAALAPGRLRVGGTEADRLVYGFRHDGPGAPAPGDEGPFVLTGRLWNRLNRWAAEARLDLVFTVAAGPEARDPEGRWDPRGAERLLRQTARKGWPVAAWEFGNEVNAFPLLYGRSSAFTARRYAEDFARFAALARRLTPGVLTVGPAAALWPLVGEPLPVVPTLTKSPAAALLDALSLHYYPQQSDRAPWAVRRAREGALLSARVLDGARRVARHGRRHLDRGPAAGRPLWITETGHALYGGARGLSDTWLSTPWWLDQLGLWAQEGVQGVFRQSLVGGDYGLIDLATGRPRPDYWASLLWKRWMGPQVHLKPLVTGRDRRLRAWHHSFPGGPSVVLLVNLDRDRPCRVEGEGWAWRARILESAGGPTAALALLDGVSLGGEGSVERCRAPSRAPGAGGPSSFRPWAAPSSNWAPAVSQPSDASPIDSP